MSAPQTTDMVWHELQAARAELTMSADEITGWQPIETAPTDGTPVLVYAQDLNPPPWGVEDKLPSFQAVASYHEDAGWCVCELREATHWMPLPERPHEQ